MISGLALCIALCLAIYTLRAARQSMVRSTILTGLIACGFFVGFVGTFGMSVVHVASYVLAVFWCLVVVTLFENI